MREIILNEFEAKTLISLLETGAYYAAEKGGDMYEETKSPYGSLIYTEEDFNLIDDEIAEFRKMSKRLLYLLDKED